MYLGKTGAVPKTGSKKRARDDVERAGVKVSNDSEDKIQSEVDDLLDSANIAYIRIPDVVYTIVFEWLEGKIPATIKRLVSAFIKGLPDTTILCKSGKFYCVELKSKKGKLSQGQKNFKRLVGESNWYTMKSCKEVEKLIIEKGIL